MLETLRLINDSSAYDAVRSTWDGSQWPPPKATHVKALDSVGFKFSNERIGDMIIGQLFSVERAAKENTKFRPVEQHIRSEEFLQRIVAAAKSMHTDALRALVEELFSNARHAHGEVEKNLELLKLTDRLADTHVNRSYFQLRYEASVEKYRIAIDLHEQVVSAWDYVSRPLDAGDDDEMLTDRFDSIFAV